MLMFPAPAADKASRLACVALSLATAARLRAVGVLLMTLLLMYLLKM